MLSKLLTLTSIRMLSLILYSFAVYIALPSENIARDLIALLIIEFFHGMLYPTGRTQTISSRICFSQYFPIMMLFSAIGVLASILLISNFFALLLVVIYLLGYPFFTFNGAMIEKNDTNSSLKIEAYSALSASLLASVFLMLGHFIGFSEEYMTPVYRLAFVPLAFAIIIRLHSLKLIFPTFEYPRLKNILTILPGLDHLGLLILFRYQLLISASEQLNSKSIIKLITVLYEPIASIYGFYLRYILSSSKFSGDEYSKKSKRFMSITFAIPISVWLLYLYFGYFEIFLGLMSIFILIGSAALTTHYIVAKKIIRLFFILNWLVLNTFLYINLPADLVIIYGSIVYLIIIYNFSSIPRKAIN